MSKISTICLTCGKVQVRTDIIENINGKYIELKEKIMCPRCKIKTKQVSTKNINNLRKQLEESPSDTLDGYLIKLIKGY